MLCYKTECLQPDIIKSLKESVLMSFGSMRHNENEKSGRERDVSLEEKFFSLPYSSPEQIKWNATESSAWCAVHSGV